MRITGSGVWGPPENRPEALRVLRRAVERDITLFDTANSYGPHISETLIAEALAPYPSELVIGTKGGFERPGPGQWRTNGRPEHLRAELEGSLRRLKLERIDLYQLHRIDPAVPEDEQFGVLQAFQREGKIRHIGLSEVSVDQVTRARRSFPVVSVQNRYNVVDRQAEDMVNYCDREGIAFIPWYPLLSGSRRNQFRRRRSRRTTE
jgi:aryl-alcohol dehydrogenase-like predicted oxidoreductase